MNKKGFTLIEVVLAIVVIAIAVSGTLVIMSKMMFYTANKGQAVDISNAVTISQRAIDNVRDQWFPPTERYGNINGVNTSVPNTDYTYKTEIVAFDENINGDSPIGINEYSGDTNIDLMLGYRNLLKVTVTVFKAGRQILKTVTYKTRNGYY